MPVFQEASHPDRDLRTYRPLPLPLPRLSAVSENLGDDTSNYEVVVIGAGPAGLFLSLCLARLGLTDDSLICFDAKSAAVKAGHADGLQPRTLEVFKSFGVLNEIYDDGCHMTEIAFWNPRTDGKGIERTNFAPDVAVRARYQHEITIHQGRVERILEQELRRHVSRGIVRNTEFLDFTLDDTNPEFPVSINLEQIQEDGSRIKKNIRSKYLVGADGAHSGVRQCMNLSLEGETTDHVWGVCDFVADTDFPDIRKRSAIHSSAGSIMVIPREIISGGEYLTRLYVQVKEAVNPLGDVTSSVEDRGQGKAKSKVRRQAVTVEYIFEQASRVLAPYTIKEKEGTSIDWYAAYQIGQRVAPRFTMGDKAGCSRVFIVGDACHTHSPKAGQGMNVSMMDSYNLSWKLAHTIHGLVPREDDSSGTNSVLASFASERLTIAQQLIDFDRKFSSLFSGEISPDLGATGGLTHEEFLGVFNAGNGFTSGCGIEYPGSCVVAALNGGPKYPIRDGDYLDGCLKPGRRLADVRVVRFADANIRHIQDDLTFNGRYRIIVFASNDLFDQKGRTSVAVEHICSEILPSFPKSMIELIVVHPFSGRRFEWTDVSPFIKHHAEMRFHGQGAGDDVYEIYGLDESEGAVVAVRPDGYVGYVVSLDEVKLTMDFLTGCLRLQV